MLARLNKVMATITMADEAGTPASAAFLDAADPPDSSSEYVPSSTGTDSSVATADGTMPPPSFELLGDGATGACAEEDSARRHGHRDSSIAEPEAGQVATVPGTVEADGDTNMDSPFDAADLSSILASQPNPSLQFDSIDRWMPMSFVASDGTLQDGDEARLLEELKGTKPASTEGIATLRIINKANSTAYGNWKPKQKKASPRAYALIKTSTTVGAACVAVQEHPDILRAVLYAVPFPEVAIAQLEATVLLHAGRAAICVARAQMLYRLQPFLPTPAAKFCQEWGESLVSSADLGARWALARDSAKWRIVTAHAKKAKVPIPPRIHPGLDVNHWARLVAFLIAVPGNVPLHFQKAGFPMQCDALLLWTSKVENVDVVSSAAAALRERRWAATLQVFQHWQQQGPRLSVTVAVSHPAEQSAGGPRGWTATATSHTSSTHEERAATPTRQAEVESGKRRTKRERRRRRWTSGCEQAACPLLCVSQNVRGLAKAEPNLSDWFTGFRKRTAHGQADVVLLQETRATDTWVPKLRAQHAREWGFRDEQLTEPLSFWQSTPTAAGGVAILLRPNSAVQNPQPLWREQWSPWFMAITVEVRGKIITVVNIYGPSGKKAVREQFYEGLRQCPKPAGPVLVGGDFNCTLDDELDRSSAAPQSHDSPALHALLEHWAVCDVLQPDMDAVVTESDKVDFRARYHTYQYRLQDGSFASSRLDRWYVSSTWTQHIRSYNVDPPVNASDHDAVSIVAAVHPRGQTRGRRRRPRVRYPLPHGCQATVNTVSHTALAEFAASVDETQGAHSAHGWDELKNVIRRTALLQIRLKLRSRQRGQRRRRQRLSRALRAALRPTRPSGATGTATVHDITDGIEALALDPAERVAGLRRAIIRLDTRRAARRRRTQFAVHAAGTPESERLFFQRFSSRQGYRVGVQLPQDAADVRAPADRLAADWCAVTQRGSCDAAAGATLLAALPAPLSRPELSRLDDNFTEEELRLAIAACPRGKAAGPDGLPNDWYRDHVDVLVDVLLPLLNTWHRQQTLPVSFRHAQIACIPKTTTPATGLDFRPIALLNTDYKIYARLLLNRVRPHLPELVAPTQYGFVPGRQVHDAIDVFHGVQALVRNQQAPPTAMAVLLDFEKAYDTVDRPFLLRVLHRAGFPPRFHAAVAQMHLLTTAEYIAGDSVSAEQAILNGIRQGCPLAPTLFVLAVDVLYELIATDAAVPGIRLPSGDEVGAVGFADDTTVYVASESALQPLRRLLSTFAVATGLHINIAKCMVIRLGDAASSDETAAASSFRIAAPADPTRLLGVQVATADVSASAWRITMQQVRARLHWAGLKTTNETQRIKLLRAILLPKFLFVARHHWPTAPVIERFQRLIDNFVWAGTLADTAHRTRAWMSSHSARAATKDGGLHLPHLTHELHGLSVDVVQRWSSPCAGLRSAIGAILLTSVNTHTLAPTRSAPSSITLLPTLAKTGTRLRCALTCTPRTPDEDALLGDLLPHVGRGTSRDYTWNGLWLAVDYSRVAAPLAQLRQLQSARYGNLLVAALLQASIVGDDLLLAPDGTPVALAHFPDVFARGDKFQDVFAVAWDTAGRIQFLARKHSTTLGPADSYHFRRFCDTVVFNYPGLLRPPGQPDDLVMRPASLDGWRLRPARTGRELWWTPVDDVEVLVGVVTSTREAEGVARRFLNSHVVHFDLHEQLDQPYALWTGLIPPTAARGRDMARDGQRAKCLVEAEARHRRWQTHDAQIADALATVTWTRVLRFPGVPASHRLLFHKLKGDRVSGWDRTSARRGCPHCPTSGSAGGQSVHIFWHCSQAQVLWHNLWLHWALWWTHSDGDRQQRLKTEVFSLRLKSLPDRIWTHPALARLGPPTEQDTVATQLALQALWYRHVLHTLYTLWRWRTTPDQPEDLWTVPQALAYHSACLRATYCGLRWDFQPNSAATTYTAETLAIMHEQALAVDADEQQDGRSPDLTPTQYILFFDGGSRGNPGPGGAGAVITAITGDGVAVRIVWSAAMSLKAATTTNNQAEYMGLLTGLTAALRNHWRPLVVVGDSQLILRQMDQYLPPKNSTLRTLYVKARRLADTLRVAGWQHHVRAYNRAADAVANLAMDSATSSQVFHPTVRDGHMSLQPLIRSDFAHWQEAHFAA